MAISFDQALGLHEQALHVRTTRARIISNNLANADTPNFKARDIDFREVLGNVESGGGKKLQMAQTQGNHQPAIGRQRLSANSATDFELQFRVPMENSIDGNTVNENVEHAEFMENALAFQASFTLLNKKFNGLKTAIRGE